MKPRRFAHGRRPEPGVMNKLEADYAAHLEARKIAGEILWYLYEHVKLKLADRTFYTSDFFVMAADETLEAHEVKGFWEDDARVKIKVAASMYPFKFIAATRRSKKDGWTFEEF